MNAIQLQLAQYLAFFTFLSSVVYIIVTIKYWLGREEDENKLWKPFAFTALVSLVIFVDTAIKLFDQKPQKSAQIVENNITYINTGIKTDVNASEVGFQAVMALTTQNYGYMPMKTENGVLYVSKEFAENVDKSTLEKAIREYKKSCAGKAKNLESYGDKK